MKPLKTKLHSDLLAALVGVGILATGPVLAKSHGEDGKMCRHMKHHGGGMLLKHFDEIDVNGDGKVTQDEVKAHHEARKKAADTDGDGKLSKAEFLAKAAAKAERKFASKDKNGDGFISEDEKGKRHHGKERIFKKLDKDGDGALTKDEIEAGKSRMMERMKRYHDKAGKES